MNEISTVKAGAGLSECSAEAIETVKAARSELAKAPQVMLPCEQHIHAGVYTRTLYIPKGICVFGTLIKRTTQLIIAGHALINDGTKAVELKGYNILDCAANRIQCAYAIDDTYATMIFATDAKTNDEAEREFTDEFELLQTRRM